MVRSAGGKVRLMLYTMLLLSKRSQEWLFTLYFLVETSQLIRLFLTSILTGNMGKMPTMDNEKIGSEHKAQGKGHRETERRALIRSG
jgi:hypothetical protein